jgi:hypothetical protein
MLLSVRIVAVCTNFLTLLLAPNAHDSAPGFTLVCHSEEPCDEESAFSFLIEPGERKADTSLSFSMTQLIPSAPKNAVFFAPLRLCGR